MKKTLKLLAIGFVAMSLAVACGNNEENAEDTTTLDTVPEVVEDTTPVDTVAVVEEPVQPAKKSTKKTTKTETKAAEPVQTDAADLGTGGAAKTGGMKVTGATVNKGKAADVDASQMGTGTAKGKASPAKGVKIKTN